MSRILRRPMFRGGRVDSRGTGITANLGYKSGGRVGYNVAGLVSPGMATEYARGQGNIRSGGQIASEARVYNRPIGPPRGSLGMGAGKFRFPMLSSSLRALSIPSLSTTGLMTAPFAPVAGLAYLNRPKNLEALQIMKDEPASTFDETGAFDFDIVLNLVVLLID